MINVTLIGQDIYLASEIEKGMLSQLAKLYEVDEDEIIVSAHESFLYHGGVEQTSYHLLVRVEAEHKYCSLEKNVAKFLLKYLENYSVHVRVYFLYFESNHLYERINEDYPLYLNESNLVNVEDSSFEDEEEDIYTGNIFEEFDRQVKAQEAKLDKNHEHHEECECHDEECECHDEECSCHHHHDS